MPSLLGKPIQDTDALPYLRVMPRCERVGVVFALQRGDLPFRHAIVYRDPCEDTRAILCLERMPPGIPGIVRWVAKDGTVERLPSLPTRWSHLLLEAGSDAEEAYYTLLNPRRTRK